MDWKYGTLKNGFDIDGRVVKDFGLRPLTVRDQYEVSKDPEAENPIYRAAALYARRLALPAADKLSTIPVSTGQVLDLADADMSVIMEADREQAAALAAGFRADGEPAA